MSHKQMQKLLSAFADGELTPNGHEEVQKHLKLCTECRQTLAELRLLRSDIRAAASIELPANFTTNLLRSVRQQNDQSVAWNGAELIARRLVLALTVVVFFIVSVGSLNSFEPPMVIEPGFSGVSADSTVQRALLQGEISEDDIVLAVMTR